MKKNIVFIGVCLIAGGLCGFSSCNRTGSNSNYSAEILYEVENQQASVCPNCGGYGVYGGYTCIVLTEVDKCNLKK